MVSLAQFVFLGRDSDHRDAVNHYYHMFVVEVVADVATLTFVGAGVAVATVER